MSQQPAFNVTERMDSHHSPSVSVARQRGEQLCSHVVFTKLAQQCSLPKGGSQLFGRRLHSPESLGYKTLKATPVAF